MEAENNHKQIVGMLFPDVSVPYEVIAEIIYYLQETRVNAEILPKVIRGVHNIMIGTGQGQVIIHIKTGKANVSIRETDREVLAKR